MLKLGDLSGISLWEGNTETGVIQFNLVLNRFKLVLTG